MGCMFMVAYMIIFSAITSLELFIQVGEARTPPAPASRAWQDRAGPFVNP